MTTTAMEQIKGRAQGDVRDVITVARKHQSGATT